MQADVEHSLKPFFFNSQRLNALAALVRGSLPRLHRNIITALITIDVHARDIVTELVQAKVNVSLMENGMAVCGFCVCLTHPPFLSLL